MNSRTFAVLLLAAAVMTASGCHTVHHDHYSTVLRPTLDVAATIGAAREAAHWATVDINSEAYANAPSVDRDAIRSRAAILSAGADNLDAHFKTFDPFATPVDTEKLNGVMEWSRQIDDDRLELLREWRLLKVRLGMRSPQDAAVPVVRFAPAGSAIR